MPLMPTTLEGWEAHERELDRKRKLRAEREAARVAKRADYAERVANAPRDEAELADLRLRLDAENERHAAAVAELEPRIASLDRGLHNIPEFERLLIETAGEAGSAYRKWNSRLQSLRSFLSEPPPDRPTVLKGFEGRVQDFANVVLPAYASQESFGRKEAAEHYERLLDEHAARTEKAHREIARLEPFVAALKALVLSATPTKDQLDEILAEHGYATSK
jgi:hypothetical protein